MKIKNEFYSITELNQEAENNYQIENLGKQTCWMMTGDFNGNSKSHYLPTTKEDYDKHFVYMITSFDPPYEISKLLDYHLNYYIKETQDKSTFLKHIKYVILPKIKTIIRKKVKRDIYIDLITEWLKESKKKKILNLNNSVQNEGDKNIIIQNVINSKIIIESNKKN